MFEKMKAIEKAGLERKTVALGISRISGESWIPPFVAFQNGFLCQDLLDTIIK